MAPALNVSARMLDQEPIPFSKTGVNSRVHSLNASQKQNRWRRNMIYKVDLPSGLSLLNPVLLAYIM